MNLVIYHGYEGEQLHIEEGGFQKLKFLGLTNLKILNRLIIDEGALPLLEKIEIGPCPLLEEVPSGIHHLKNLKDLEFFEMSREFVLSMQPDEGPDFWKVKHVPFVCFWYRIQGECYKTYKLGDSELLEHLQRKVKRWTTKVPSTFLRNHSTGFKYQHLKDIQVPDRTGYSFSLNQPEYQLLILSCLTTFIIVLLL
ncbi:probable disease resistance RPP8-like protein 4 [Quercus robur]|uniref:probable disease resistance RPP8-like protein 4 n=1 Tax=Quercus robur TaxID=38942 RepID=UPI00216168D6|nr:probable disease resistance RPP8-like protein 4 [Quercus robur]